MPPGDETLRSLLPATVFGPWACNAHVMPAWPCPAWRLVALSHTHSASQREPAGRGGSVARGLSSSHLPVPAALPVSVAAKVPVPSPPGCQLVDSSTPSPTASLQQLIFCRPGRPHIAGSIAVLQLPLEHFT